LKRSIPESFIKIAEQLHAEKEKLKQYHEIKYKEPTVQELRKELGLN
jgi:hypothetical protein